MNRANVSLQQDNATNILRLRKGVLQRKCACRNKTIARGECAGCAKKKNNLQRKLSIGASNDPLEREADRVADQVMAMSGNSSIGRTTPRIQRFTGQSVGQTDIAPASVDRVLASSGQPMEPALRQDMEQRFGHDFSQVRVHTGAPAERSARDMNANAYTAGHNIVFGEGQFSSGSNEGQRLIAHELTHVVQQEGAVGKQIRKEETNSPVISPKLTFSSQYQFVQLQRGVASIRETTINVRWIDDDVRFYHRVINAISRSRRFRGVRKASLWQPFHDPIFRLFHRLARRRPLLSTAV